MPLHEAWCFDECIFCMKASLMANLTVFKLSGPRHSSRFTQAAAYVPLPQHDREA